ncbi:MAG: helix-turn-helix domain-containing protein [Clostridiales bacterium]|nr:helix-turn-helix domain-containing protein [Clostridiales bacterium]
MFDEYPDILTVQDIMRALDIGRNKAYDMLKHNQIKSIKIGSNYRIPKTYLIEFVYKTVSV